MSFFPKGPKGLKGPEGLQAGRAPVLWVLWVLFPWATAAAPPIPDRPEQLRFDELRFEIPPAEKHRHVLKSGVPVYIVEDHTLPLVDIAVAVRGEAGRWCVSGSAIDRDRDGSWNGRSSEL